MPSDRDPRGAPSPDPADRTGIGGDLPDGTDDTVLVPAQEPAEWDGDSAIAVPLDVPHPGRASFTVSELARRAEQARASTAANTPRTSPTDAFEKDPAGSSPPTVRASTETAIRRRYPKMLALLRNPEAVSLGSEAPPSPRAVPVPRTFFPARDPKPPEPVVPELDSMLGAMADGFFTGGDDQGNAQVLITLRDDFFRGTELRIGIHESEVTALLLPPDRDTWRHLSAEVHRLRARLEERGLRVASVKVEEPTSP